MNGRLLLALPLMLLAASACTADTQSDEEQFPEDRCNEEGVSCQAYGRARGHQNRAPAYELGDGTRTPTLKIIYQGQSNSAPVDLEFNPRAPRELWVLHYGTSRATIIKNAGLASAEVIE